ncbi:unnamed protein product [Chrysoparadoxa australica]
MAIVDDRKSKKALAWCLKKKPRVAPKQTVVGSGPEEVFTYLAQLENSLEGIADHVKTVGIDTPSPTPARFAPPGSGAGVGAIYIAFLETPVRTKHGTTIKKSKCRYTVVECEYPTRLQILQEYEQAEGCCLLEGTAPPSLTGVQITRGPDGSAELTVSVYAPGATLYQAYKQGSKPLRMLPCFWPHLVIITAIFVLASPCISSCITNSVKQGVKDAAEKMKIAAQAEKKKMATSSMAVSTAAVPQYGAYVPTQPSSPAAVAPEMMHVIVPEGMYPGSSIHVQAPNGALIQVTIPAGVAPGTPIMVAIPPT